jgi:hypothetical protein
VILGADGKPLRRAIGFSRGLEPYSTYNDDSGPDLIGTWEGPWNEEAVGEVELSQPRPSGGRDPAPRDPGEDPKGAGDSPNRSTTQGEQYPGQATRSAGAGNGLARSEER